MILSSSRATLCAVLISAALMTLTCGCSPTDRRHASPRVDAKEAQTVARPDDGQWGTDSWEFVEQYVLTGPPGAPFGMVQDIALGPQGTLYVLDGYAQEVHSFAPDGRYLGKFGSRGDGPGEFLGAVALATAPSGDVLVFDSRRNTYTVFDRDGVFIRTAVRAISGVLLPWPGRFVGERVVDWSVDHIRERSDGPAVRTVIRAIQLDTAFALGDTLDVIDYPRLVTPDRELSVPFGGSPSVHIGPDGVVWASDPNRYRLIKRVAGDSTLTAGLEVTPASVTSREKDSIAALIRERMPPPLVEGRLRSLDHLPDEKPVVRRVFGDDAELLFVLPELDGVQPGGVIDVFDQSGLFLGRVKPPRRLALTPQPVARDGEVYSVVLDQHEVPSVVRWRIQRP